MRRFVTLLIIGIAAAVFSVVVSSSTAQAVEPVAYWDGPEAIIIKHPFFSTGQEDGDEDIHAIDNSKRFILDRYTRDQWRFIAEGMSVEVRSGDNTCTYTSLYFDLSAEDDGTFTAKSNYDYQLGASKGEAGIAVMSSKIKGGWFNSALGADDPCERAFVGENATTDSSLNTAIHERVGSLNKPFKLADGMGMAADISAFRDQLDVSKDNETTRYIHRICGTEDFNFNPSVGGGLVSPLTSGYIDCTDQAKKAYTTIWQYCERYAVTLHDQRQRVDSFKSCIQDRSGVDVHSSSISNILFNEIDYEEGESCSIRYIGWIICPLSRFMASVTDAAFDGLSQFMVIKPLDRGQLAGDALYRAWSLVNTIANVLFIVGFMVIIFSQVTGRGMNNYSIKRLLPKIILTAILVNLSYYICIIAVDLSNIVGTSLKDVIAAIEPQQFTKPSTWTEEVENLLVFGAMAAGGAYIILTASIVAMLPLLVGALLSFVIAVIMMVARYAIILILIIIAPLALVCTLLPNTQKWYSQWFKLFSSMLLLFPLISIVFGGAQVAGIIVLNSSLARSTGDITLQLFGLAIMALPLAVTPLLVKLSGGVLNRFGGVVSNNGFFNKTKKRTEDFVERKKNARDMGVLQRTGDKKRGGVGGLRDRLRQREYLRKAQSSLNTQEQGRSQSQYTSAYAAGTAPGSDKVGLLERAEGRNNPDYTPLTRGEKFAKNLTKGGVSKSTAEAMAISDEVNINTEQVKAARASKEIQEAYSKDAAARNSGADDMEQMAALANDENIDTAIRQAAIEIVMEQGSGADIISVVKHAQKNDSKDNKHVLRTVARGATSARAVQQAAFLGQPGVARTIISGQAGGDTGFAQQIVAPYLEKEEYSEMSIGTMSTGALNETQAVIEAGHVTQAIKTSVVQAASSAQHNNYVSQKSKRKDDKALEDLAKVR